TGDAPPRHVRAVPDGDAPRAGSLVPARPRAGQLRPRAPRRGGGGVELAWKPRADLARPRRHVLARGGAPARRTVRPVREGADHVRPRWPAPLARGGLGPTRLVEPGGRALSGEHQRVSRVSGVPEGQRPRASVGRGGARARAVPVRSRRGQDDDPRAGDTALAAGRAAPDPSRALPARREAA